MSVIVFSDWNNYTEDGVPKVLDWNNLEFTIPSIPMTALLQAINEKLDLINSIPYFFYPFVQLVVPNELNVNNAMNLYNPFLEVFRNSILSCFQDTALYPNEVSLNSITVLNNLTDPYMGALTINNFLDWKWFRQQKEILDNCIWILGRRKENLSHYYGFEIKIGNIKVSPPFSVSLTTLENDFNSQSFPWLSLPWLSPVARGSMVRHTFDKNYASGTRILQRMALQMRFISNTNIQSLKYVIASNGSNWLPDGTIHNGSVAHYENNDNGTLRGEVHAYLAETTPSTLTTVLNTASLYKKNTMTLSLDPVINGYYMDEMSMVAKLNVTGGFKFVPNIIV